jgi:hypothetical protein
MYLQIKKPLTFRTKRQKERLRALYGIETIILYEYFARNTFRFRRIIYNGKEKIA